MENLEERVKNLESHLNMNSPMVATKSIKTPDDKLYEGVVERLKQDGKLPKPEGEGTWESVKKAIIWGLKVLFVIAINVILCFTLLFLFGGFVSSVGDSPGDYQSASDAI